MQKCVIFFQPIDDLRSYFNLGRMYPMLRNTAAPPTPQISMFCALSQNYQHFLEKKYMHLIENYLRNIKMDQNNQTVVWINNSRAAWPILEFLGQFTIRCIYFFFPKKMLIILRNSTKHAYLG